MVTLLIYLKALGPSANTKDATLKTEAKVSTNNDTYLTPSFIFCRFLYEESKGPWKNQTTWPLTLIILERQMEASMLVDLNWAIVAKTEKLQTHIADCNSQVQKAWTSDHVSVSVHLVANPDLSKNKAVYSPSFAHLLRIFKYFVEEIVKHLIMRSFPDPAEICVVYNKNVLNYLSKPK